MTTEVQRIPGPFNLPAGWPRVDIIDLDEALFARYVVGGYSPGSIWADEQGNAPLTSFSSPGPPLATNPDGVAFLEADQMFAESSTLAQTHTGPLTVSGVFRWNTADVVNESSWFFSTSSGGGDFYGLRVNENNGELVAAAGSNAFAAAMPESQMCAVVVVFDGESSSVTINGNTTIGTTGDGVMPVIRLGNNSAYGAGLNGRIAEVQVHKRALNVGEVQEITTQLRDAYGI